MINPCRRADVAFTYIREIGQEGRNSVVHLANDDHLEQEVVIKEVKKSHINSDEYFREARLLYMSNHPNVVQINFAAQDVDNIYISMPYYANGSVSSKMERQRFTPREVIRYSLHFLNGLHHIHTKGLMHFDIKPNNLMLSDRDEALLADFGLSEIIDKDNRAFPGNQYVIHIPPEYFSERSFGFTYDIYQAGMTIYRMAVGFDAFNAEIDDLFRRNSLQNDICTGSFPAKSYEEHIPKPLRKIINKCLEIDPQDRYQSVLDILNDLSSIDDCCLDWRPLPADQGSSWSKKVDGIELIFNVVDGQSTCYRINEVGQKRKYSALCHEGLTSAKVYKLLKDNG
ncbi:serine/threonine protein kinase [Kosakonia sacchari]|uniref:serine/threonine-protein kinase n=1 Tax=Kosakonia sacchari TaxID=1158459 RepID=UPI002ACE4944|nr:serine/threonine-protein kinase [Kosakonia sacchari]MDZ7322073.1 serine/threonine protein kinase [Kosakonia sacchari]